MTNLFNYIDRSSPVHRLTGATKFACLLLWSLAAMTTFDTRILLPMPLAALVLFMISGIRFREVKVLFWFTFVFMVLNNVLIYVFSPEHGVELYGARHVIWEGVG
ncbi:MAG: energy-coupling factor transporter transmembrane protein EcfT, partial [Clostridia bacterium]|nr:energy-coupling factor transporter transmembrane protein EcfT [Clostridia bacterium]